MSEVLHGDCLELMKDIPTKSIDMILCDLPYGTTACKWDTILPFDLLWAQYERIIKDNGAIVLTSNQPFTTSLISSCIKLFRYNLIWEKSKQLGFMNANKAPLKTYEEISIFYKKQPVYSPQGLVEVNAKRTRRKDKETTVYGNMGVREGEYIQRFTNYPNDIIKINSEGNTVHPTQKPVALFEYLVKTYTNAGDTVLDNCAGSGTTAIACLNTGRNYILMEQERKYIDVIHNRIDSHWSSIL